MRRWLLSRNSSPAGGGQQSSRSGLRIVDLKQRPVSATRLMNVKIPATLSDAIDRLADEFSTSKTEVVVALLNTGLDLAAEKVKGLRSLKTKGSD
ncbi:MAG: hypothetical protein H6Q33_1200 [Deltaproteobacteria bacterium]|nr:hypothetical protein [Deltaproteobacteria bacterium]